MELKVELKNVYGVERIYPVCDKAKILTRLTGNKTLSRDEIKLIKMLGYKINNQAPNLQKGKTKMIIDKNNEGAWRITEIINGYFETKVYYFYTKKEAIKKFNQFKKERKKNENFFNC